LIKRETAKLSTVLRLQEQYDTYVTFFTRTIQYYSLKYILNNIMIWLLWWRSHYCILCFFCCVTL